MDLFTVALYNKLFYFVMAFFFMPHMRILEYNTEYYKLANKTGDL